MKKFLFAFTFLLVAGGSYLWIERAPIASNILSKNADMKIDVEDVALFPLTFHGVHVKDEKSKTDLTVGSLTIDTPLYKLMKNPVEIEKLSINKLTLHSDIDALDMLQYSSLLKLKKKNPTKAPTNDRKKIQINAISVHELQAEVGHPFGDEGEKIRLKVPSFSMDHLNEMTVGELMEQVLKKANKR